MSYDDLHRNLDTYNDSQEDEPMYEVYRCPNGHTDGFKIDVAISATEYVDVYGEVYHQDLYDSDDISAAKCIECDAIALVSGEDF